MIYPVGPVAKTSWLPNHPPRQLKPTACPDREFWPKYQRADVKPEPQMVYCDSKEVIHLKSTEFDEVSPFIRIDDIVEGSFSYSSLGIGHKLEVIPKENLISLQVSGDFEITKDTINIINNSFNVFPEKKKGLFSLPDVQNNPSGNNLNFRSKEYKGVVTKTKPWYNNIGMVGMIDAMRSMKDRYGVQHIQMENLRLEYDKGMMRHKIPENDIAWSLKNGELNHIDRGYFSALYYNKFNNHLFKKQFNQLPEKGKRNVLELILERGTFNEEMDKWLCSDENNRKILEHVGVWSVDA